MVQLEQMFQRARGLVGRGLEIADLDLGKCFHGCGEPVEEGEFDRWEEIGELGEHGGFHFGMRSSGEPTLGRSMRGLLRAVLLWECQWPEFDVYGVIGAGEGQTSVYKT